MADLEKRTEKISVNLTPTMLKRLDQFRKDNHWPMSTAAAVLIEQELDRLSKEEDQR